MNQLVHDYLLNNGYAHEHFPADWEDVGDSENGPCVDGHPAMDVYTGDQYIVFIDDSGRAFIEKRDHDQETYFQRLAGEFYGVDTMPSLRETR